MATPYSIYVLQTIYKQVEAILSDYGIEGFQLFWEYPPNELPVPSIVISMVDWEDEGHMGLGEEGIKRNYYVSIRVCAENAIREMMVREVIEQVYNDMGWFDIKKWSSFPPDPSDEGEEIIGALTEVVAVEKEYDPDNPILALRYTGYIVVKVKTARLSGART